MDERGQQSIMGCAISDRFNTLFEPIAQRQSFTIEGSFVEESTNMPYYVKVDEVVFIPDTFRRVDLEFNNKVQMEAYFNARDRTIKQSGRGLNGRAQCRFLGRRAGGSGRARLACRR